MTKSSPLTVVPSSLTGPQPSRPLAEHGRALWDSIQRDYCIGDAGGVELLALACQELDRAEALAAQIDRDGLTLRTKSGWRANPLLREELSARAFVARTLQRLGLNLEVIGKPGRPGMPVGGWTP